MAGTSRGKTPKCKHCGQWVDKSLNDHTQNNKGYYHNSCFTIASVDGQHYKELIEYICNSFNMKAPAPIILAQIKHFKEKKEMKYKGIEMTIRYLLEVEQFAFLEIYASGIQMVEWYYNKARAYYMNQHSAVESFVGVEIHNKPEKIMVLKRNKKNSTSKQIKIEEL